MLVMALLTRIIIVLFYSLWEPQLLGALSFFYLTLAIGRCATASRVTEVGGALRHFLTLDC